MNTQYASFVEENLDLALAVFKEIDLDGILRDADDSGITSTAQAIFKAARKADEENNHSHSAVLMLLDEVCWADVSSDGERPFGKGVFSEPMIRFFKEIAEHVPSPILRGKLAELIWSNSEPPDKDFALLAIDSYKEIPLDADTWFDGGDKYLGRAINLCRRLGSLTQDRLDQIESSLFSAIMAATTERGFYAHMLAETLMDSKLAKPHAEAIATRLQTLATRFERDDNYNAARAFYDAAGQWYRLSGDEEKSYDLTVLEGGAIEKEANSRISTDDPSYRFAAGILGDAVLVYRSIPGTHRERHNVDKKIQDLRSLISKYSLKAVDELITVSTPSVDVSEIVERSRSAVTGKSLPDALRAFSSLFGIDRDKLREMAIRGLSDYPLRRLFPTDYLSGDGRVVHRTQGLKQPIDSEENEELIHVESIEFHFTSNIQIAVLAKILPALDVLESEHQIGEIEFADIARRAPIVPNARELIWGKILSYGFNREFATAIHLLAPQFEHVVRYHLKKAGAITSNFYQDKTEPEKSLNRLLEFEEAEVIFGKNLLFEIKTLFCDSAGPNLRNHIAHGNLDDPECVSLFSIYAWWLGFKLVFQSFWSVAFQDSEVKENWWEQREDV